MSSSPAHAAGHLHPRAGCGPRLANAQSVPAPGPDGARCSPAPGGRPGLLTSAAPGAGWEAPCAPLSIPATLMAPDTCVQCCRVAIMNSLAWRLALAGGGRCVCVWEAGGHLQARGAPVEGPLGRSFPGGAPPPLLCSLTLFCLTAAWVRFPLPPAQKLRQCPVGLSSPPSNGLATRYLCLPWRTCRHCPGNTFFPSPCGILRKKEKREEESI